MENKTETFQFKTNINCGGCIAAVKPHLDGVKGIGDWNVNTSDKNKVLTVTSTGITEEQVIDIVKKAGYKIEDINS